MNVTRIATLVTGLVVFGFAAFGVLAADAANPPSFTAVVNTLDTLPAGSVVSPSTLACVSATECFASGTYGGSGPYLLHGNPAIWDKAGTTLSTAPLGGAMTCTSSTFCVAVDGPSTLAGDPATWDASDARTIDLGDPFGAQSFSSVACTSPTYCVAVGEDFFDYFNSQPLVLAGDPSTWTAANARQITLGGSRGNGGSLASVSCASQTQCVAVGYAGQAGHYSGYKGTRHPLVLSGNPATWGLAQTTEISGIASGSVLSSVACPSAKFCVSVGRPEVDGAPSKPFVFAGKPRNWNGNSALHLSWTAATPSSVRPGAWEGIDASWYRPFLPFTIACKSTVYCVVAGDDSDGGPLYITGNPAYWAGRRLSRPAQLAPSFVSADLTSAACVSTACFVGGISNGGNFVATLK